jgi:hypothetical protein
MPQIDSFPKTFPKIFIDKKFLFAAPACPERWRG